MGLAARVRLAVCVAALVALGAGLLLREALRHGVTPPVAWTIAVGIALAAALWAAQSVIARFDELYAVLGNALRAFRDGDFSLRLSVRGDREIADLKLLYNELADVVRADRNEIYQKELLLDTILQRTPMAVMLLNPAHRVVYSNSAARELLADGGRVDGRMLEEIAAAVEAPLREALAGDGDAVFSVSREGREETFHLTHRTFGLNAQIHHLLLIERLTPEIRRKELSVWKNAIRLINHEMNNSIAPIRSMFHSAQRALETPAHRHKVDDIHRLIGERLTALQSFLESYAQFARLPDPHKERTRWSEVLDAVETVVAFRTEGQPAAIEGVFDRIQMQQVLINLVKNAHESGSDPGEVVVSVHRTGTDSVLRVADRGRGMSPDVLRNALLPFYTTKPGGTGVGLALCNEIVEAHGGRMRIEPREGGGTVVTCWLPQ